MSPALYVAAGAVLVALAAGVAGYVTGRDHGAASVRQEWDRDRAQRAEETSRQQAKAREREQSLQRQADARLKEKDREIAAVAGRAAALADSLRNRPEERALPVPDAAGPVVGCTGAGLARPDADFLVRYAADAARLQAALQQCRAGYQAARDSLDAAAKEVNRRAAP